MIQIQLYDAIYPDLIEISLTSPSQVDPFGTKIEHGAWIFEKKCHYIKFHRLFLFFAAPASKGSWPGAPGSSPRWAPAGGRAGRARSSCLTGWRRLDMRGIREKKHLKCKFESVQTWAFKNCLRYIFSKSKTKKNTWLKLKKHENGVHLNCKCVACIWVVVFNTTKSK